MRLSREQLTAMMGGKRHFNWSNGDLTPVKDEVDADGGPGSGNHGHEGVPGQVGGSAPSLTPAASKLLHGKSEDFKAEFLVEKGMRFREVDKAIQAGKLDELVDEKLREVAKERKRVADKAPDDSKVRKSAEKASGRL